MNKMISASLLSLFLMAAPSLAAMPASADKADAPMNVDKASFVKVVTSSNAFEIESSKLAEQKAKDADVKEFAAAMIKDHSKAAEDLKKAAKLDDTPPVLSPKHAAMLETLKGASDQDFQPLYIEMQTTAHMEAVTLFAVYAKGGDDEAVKAFAQKTLPTLEMHKMHVMKLVAAH
jgi:putative membrane protein